MGQRLSKTLESLPSYQFAKTVNAVNETVEIICSLAQAELELLYQKLRPQDTVRESVPLDKIIAKKAYFCNDYRQEWGLTETIIKNEAPDFVVEGMEFEGILQGIARVINLALIEMHGLSSPAKQTKEVCLVSVGVHGTLLRLDMTIMYHRCRSKQLQSGIKNFNAVLMVVSSIKVEGMTRSDLAAITHRVYGDSDVYRQGGILEDLNAARVKQVEAHAAKPHISLSSTAK